MLLAFPAAPEHRPSNSYQGWHVIEPLHVTLAQLRCLRAVAEQGGFVAAAEHLNLSQSAVSHAVKALEQTLGATLLLRGHRGGIALTSAGAPVLAGARQVATALETMAAEVANATGTSRLTGTLRIGVVQSAAVHLLPAWLRQLQADQPGIAVTLHEGTDPEVMNWVLAGIAEIGVTSRTHAHLSATPVRQDAYVVVVPNNHPLAGRSGIALRELDGHRMLLSGGGCETLIQELLAASGSNPDIVCLVRDNATLASMVAAGLGLTIMPELALPPDRTGLTIVTLKPTLRRTLHLLTAQPDIIGPLTQALLAVAKRTAESTS